MSKLFPGLKPYTQMIIVLYCRDYTYNVRKIIITNCLTLADLSSVRMVDMVEVAGTPVSLPCHHNQPQLSKLEWRCRGCFSISNTKESRSVTWWWW